MAKIKLEVDTETHQGSTQEARFLAAPNKIGVVSTITMTGTVLETAFRSGVNDSTVSIKISHNAGYKSNNTQALNGAITGFNGSADLIVTAGGLVAYAAAVLTATKPFVSLFGAVPTNPPSLYRGGVSLESFGSNKDRIALLGTKAFGMQEIGLFCNQNSTMNQDEIPDWNFQIGANNQVFTGGNDNNGNNNSGVYAADLAKIPPAIRALVISADPFFQDSKQQLIQACNAWIATGAAAAPPIMRYICYPSLTHANIGGTPPTPTKATLYGPDLVTAYSLLGQLALVALRTSASVPTLRLGNSSEDL
jgi:hypothetical protein